MPLILTRELIQALPDHMQDPAVDSEQFRRDLKTYLFAGHSKNWRIRAVYVVVLYKSTFAYLLFI